ncbi:class I SAM-dependent methyltransferase [Candidatus Kaiserbacteria bacterium]|nr:class I SAM-dependent methyltransferase [Candidatus Kaiserbacteria bacterium]
MLKKLKDKLYFLKTGYQALFLYPQRTIDTRSSIDYDRYWRDKRGSALGNLSDWQKVRADLVLKNIDKKSLVSIGDIGCGDGSALTYLKTKLNLTRSAGYDVSRLALERAEDNGLETFLLDVRKENELERIQEADYILMFEVIEHVPHSEKLLNSAYTKTLQGVFFSIPNTGYLSHRFRLLFGKAPMQWKVFPDEHLRFWTLVDLKWWLKAQGYKNYTITCYKGIPILNRLWPNLFAAGLFVYIKKQNL